VHKKIYILPKTANQNQTAMHSYSSSHCLMYYSSK